MTPRLSTLTLTVATLITLAALAPPAQGQGSFERADGLYDDHSILYEMLNPTRFESMRVRMNNAGGGTSFTLTVPPAQHYDGYYPILVYADLDGDGTDDFHIDVDDSQPITRTFTYPQPASWADKYTARIDVFFGSATGPKLLADEFPIYVIGRERIYADPAGNALVQLRDEDCTNRIPVVIVEGWDARNTTFPWEYVYNFRSALDSLYDNNAEVFVLNFADAGASLLSNAVVVDSALAKLHRLCPNNGIAVIGFSMGGAITKYALASAERQGVDHHVGLFVSFDAPQQGANANLSLQEQLAKTQAPDNWRLAELKLEMQSQAAREMLLTNYYDDYAEAFHNFYDRADTTNGNGFPHHSYNVAISNGSESTIFPQGKLLAGGKWLADATIYVNGSGLPVIHILANEIDVGAASKRHMTTSLSMHHQFNFLIVNFNVDLSLEVGFDPGFIPTWSALGVPLDSTAMDPLGNITGYLRPIRFDDSYVHEAALYHQDASLEARSHLMGWLRRSSTLNVAFHYPQPISEDAMDVAVGGVAGTAVTIAPRVRVFDGRDIVYVFDHWDDGSTENPRLFSSGRDVTMGVTMRPSQVASVSGDLWANGPRRVVEETDGTYRHYHAVYESNGAIQYMRNRRGLGWETERDISSELGPGAGAPAIATWTTGHENEVEIHVGWRMPDGGIGYRVSNRDNGATWKPIKTIYATEGAGPVLPDALSMLWSECGVGGGIYYLKQPETNGNDPFLLAGTSGEVNAIATCIGSEGQLVGFVRGESLYVVGYVDPNLLNPNVAPSVTSGPICVSTTGWVARNPSIVNWGSEVFLAWEETNAGATRIAVRQRSGGSWGSPTYFNHGGDVVSKPVVGRDGACGRIQLVWQCADHVALASREYQGCTWSGVQQLWPGRSPSLARETQQSTYGSMAMWTSGTTAPYSVNLSMNMPCSDATAPAAVTDLGRGMGTTTVTASWTAPGDDGTCGQASEYDLRYSLGAITEANFQGATRIATAVPGAPGTPECAEAPTLASCALHYFAVKTRDEAGNWSALSNVASGTTRCSGSVEVSCSGGGFMALSSGEGGLVAENTVLIDPIAGSTSSDVLKLGHSLTAGSNGYRVRLENHSATAVLVDHVSLMVLDHSSQQSAFVLNARVMCGDIHTPRQVAVTGQDGQRTLLTAVSSATTFALGDTLEVTLDSAAVAPKALLLVARTSAVASNGQPGGIVVQVNQGDGGWETVAHLYPRKNFGQLVIDGLRTPLARLVVLSDVSIRQIATVANVTVVSPQDVLLSRAEDSAAGNVMTAVADGDGTSASIAPGGSLTLEFSAVPKSLGGSRDWFLNVQGSGSQSASALSSSLVQTRSQDLPTSFGLLQNSPNPFKGTTAIRFQVPRPSWVMLDVFDLQGRQVRRLVNRLYASGLWSVDWDRRQEDGAAAAPGIYLYRLRAAGFEEQKKMILLP